MTLTQVAIVLNSVVAGLGTMQAVWNHSAGRNGQAIASMVIAAFCLSWAVLAITGTFDRWAAKP